MKPKVEAKGGFVLAEVVIVLVMSSIVVVALLAGLIALIRGLQPQRVTLSSEELPIAPTFGSFPSAVRLHHTLTNRAAAARAIYVFGGQHLSIPTEAAAAQVRPLKLQTLPVIADMTRGLPMDAKSFYDLYASELGDQETNTAAEDFSVAMVGMNGNSLAITCLVQVRRHDISVSDGTETIPFTVREVKLWDAEEGAQRYAYAERPAFSSRVFIGAVHTWLRYRVGAVSEEGPTCAVFPDPWVYAGSRGQADDIPAFSRFSYFLAVSP